MKALQITKPGEFRIIDVSIPKIDERELLMEIEAVTTCPRWDILTFEGKNLLTLEDSAEYPVLPGWPGHEVAGVVTEVGSKVRGYKVGDRIAAYAAKMLIPGETGYAQFMKFRENEIIKLADNISFEEAAPLELLQCVVKGLNQFGDLRGRSIVIAGLGPAGLLAIQLAKLWGASKVYGADISERRLAYASSLGIGNIVHANTVSELNFELGFDCVGFASSVQNLIDHAKSHVVVFGVLHGELKYGDHLWRRGLKLETFSRKPLSQVELNLLIRALESDQLNTKHIITHHGTFEKYDEAIQLLKSQEAIKVCFFPKKEFSS